LNKPFVVLAAGYGRIGMHTLLEDTQVVFRKNLLHFIRIVSFTQLQDKLQEVDTCCCLDSKIAVANNR
jgi:hypothetical protein